MKFSISDHYYLIDAWSTTAMVLIRVLTAAAQQLRFYNRGFSRRVSLAFGPRFTRDCAAVGQTATAAEVRLKCG